MSSIVVFNINGLDDNNVEQERALRDFLREQKIFVTVRCSTGLGGMRVSFHHYTKKEDIEHFWMLSEHFQRSMRYNLSSARKLFRRGRGAGIARTAL